MLVVEEQVKKVLVVELVEEEVLLVSRDGSNSSKNQASKQ